MSVVEATSGLSAEGEYDNHEMPPDSIESMRVIPEWVIEAGYHQVAHLLKKVDNPFRTYLKWAKILGDAGLTPVYLLSKDNTTIAVTSEEKMNDDFEGIFPREYEQHK